jgi:isopenicillin N synthase-like dioxygenase
MTDRAPAPRMPTMVGGSMPVIDVGPYFRGEPGALETAAAELRYASEQVGFYFLTGHGISEDLISGTFDAARRFHDQPMEEKQAVKVNSDNLGYMPMKGSITKTSKVNVNTKPNLNEAYFLKREFDEGTSAVPRNQWPANLPGFREATAAYTQAMETMGRRLVPIYARALGMPTDYFDGYFTRPDYTLRLSHYPHTEVLEDNEFGVAPHTDSNFATFLPPNPVNGLAIRLKDGTWFDVPYMPGAFVVNTADTLARWSNDVFVSTPHRVINRSGEERYAIPFFLNANSETLIECLPTCTDAEHPPKYEAMTVRAYADWFQRTNYLHLQKATPEPATAAAG